ncbi:MAG TPA: hypothetical protein VMV73_05675 [Candidatus Dormibacteraeota bacterium]|nr:hypothetical protein [Candidatus Dormibacteraeota bacterium]
MERFLLGVNYWPARSAMYAWEHFNAAEWRDDMARIAALGLDTVRFFLRWEDFQPSPNRIDDGALARFDAAMDAIAEAGLRAMPTLFCGHMSGVNWLPPWTLDPATPHGRFRTMTRAGESPYGIGDFYADEALLAAQQLFAETIGARARGHRALWCWDLGNEFSNLREPREPANAARWSALLTKTLLDTSGIGVTGGIHGEDFERDRHIRPSSIAAPWSFATMHGYSVYSAFARDRLDSEVVPYLAELARSCSGKRVLFSEFGNPACPPDEIDPASAKPFACLTEREMADYCIAVVEHLHARGALGAMWWCWSDYDSALAALPPFDLATHEFRFGMVRADGTLKPVAHALATLAGREMEVLPRASIPFVDEAAYYASLPAGIATNYARYVADAR